MKCDANMVHWAADTASSLLAPLGNRWLHVEGVAERARWVGKTFHDDDRLCLIAAAYMHDIGYAPALKKTGFHPLDGAYYLRSLGYDRLASLVAHHSEARFEASLRGYEAALNEFPRERSAVADALTYCDLTTGPTGEPITLKERAAEIFSRYGDTDAVTQSLRQSMPLVSLAVARTSRRLYRYGLIKRARR